jgi:hypothetical protein
MTNNHDAGVSKTSIDTGGVSWLALQSVCSLRIAGFNRGDSGELLVAQLRRFRA